LAYIYAGAPTGFFFQGRAIGGKRGQWLGGTMASAGAPEPPAGYRGRAPGQEVRGQSPLKLKAFWSLDVQRSGQI